jgi:hypothetical protein
VTDETPLHEDWADVRGLPPYGWILRWPSPTAIALYKVAIMGRTIEERRHYYVTRMVERVFASKNYKAWNSRDLTQKFRRGKTPENFRIEDLLFSQDDFDRWIERGGEYHRGRVTEEIRQARYKMEALAKDLASMDDGLQALREPIPSRVWATLPEKSPKRKTARRARSTVY